MKKQFALRRDDAQRIFLDEQNIFRAVNFLERVERKILPCNEFHAESSRQFVGKIFRHGIGFARRRHDEIFHVSSKKIRGLKLDRND